MSTRHLAAYVSVLVWGVAATTLGGCGSGDEGSKATRSGVVARPRVNPDAARPDGSKACETVDFAKVPMPPEGDEGWLDDFEDSNRKLASPFIGGWNYPTDDKGNVTIELGTDPSPVEGNSYDPQRSSWALHVVASLGTLPHDADHWGVNWQYEWPGGGTGDFGTDPETQQKREKRGRFDWSAYGGLVIWARWGGKEGTQRYVSVQIPTARTSRKLEGGDGSCVDEKSADAGATGTGKCYAHMTRDFAATDCWRPFVIPFQDMTPAFTPGTDSMDIQNVFGVELGFSSSSDTAAKTYWPVDMWFDDIYLYKNE